MSIASELQDKINSKAAIKAAIEAKGVTVGDVKLNQYASKIDEIEQGGGDPSIPVGTGQHLVTFYDFDGKVLKRERVATGGNATAPAIPTHQYLTFAEWNNPFTNVQSDIDTGAIYNTTDGKTYLFITLTAVTGLAPTLYFSKSSTSLMTIDWGDGTTSTSATSGNQSIQHTYAVAGDYIITVDNSAGGTVAFGLGTSGNQCFGSLTYKDCLTKVYFSENGYPNSWSFNTYKSLQYVSLGSPLGGGLVWFYQSGIIHLNLRNTSYQYATVGETSSLKSIVLKKGTTQLLINSNLSNCYSLTQINIPDSVTRINDAEFQRCYSLKRLTFSQNITLISANSFFQCFGIIEYVFLSTTPPTLANINVFTGINPICKIYVPDASVNAYKTATNWVTYANYIYPLSQKPQSDE